MNARPLTPEEERWVRRLRKVLADAPLTVHLLTSGDRCVSVIDAALADGDLHDGAAERRGAVLVNVPCAVRVHGVSG